MKGEARCLSDDGVCPINAIQIRMPRVVAWSLDVKIGTINTIKYTFCVVFRLSNCGNHNMRLMSRSHTAYPSPL